MNMYIFVPLMWLFVSSLQFGAVLSMKSILWVDIFALDLSLLSLFWVEIKISYLQRNFSIHLLYIAFFYVDLINVIAVLYMHYCFAWVKSSLEVRAKKWRLAIWCPEVMFKLGNAHRGVLSSAYEKNNPQKERGFDRLIISKQVKKRYINRS